MKKYSSRNKVGNSEALKKQRIFVPTRKEDRFLKSKLSTGQKTKT